MSSIPQERMPLTECAQRKHVKRFERSSVFGVIYREMINFKTYWRSSLVSSTVEPTVYLLAFGFGIGALVKHVDGICYIDFVATGVVGTAVLYASAFPAMFGTLVKYQYQRTYDAILAAPVDTEEVVTAEVTWIAMRTGIFACIPLVVAMIVAGLKPSWGMLLVPLFACTAGFGWACFGVIVAAVLNAFENFSYVVSALLQPLMFLSGAFFPLSNFPRWAQVAGEFNPIHQCVELVRHAAFGFHPGTDLLRFAGLLIFAFVLWRLAIWRMSRRLID